MLVRVCFEPMASVWKKGLGSVNSVNDLVPIELENGRDPMIKGVDAAVRLENLDPTFRVVEVTKRLLCSPELSIAPEGIEPVKVCRSVGHSPEQHYGSI
jgi:hypothetical protein